MTKDKTFAKGETPISTRKTQVEATGKKLAGEFIKGGKGADKHMFGKQAANAVKSGTSSGKRNTKGVDTQFAEGGGHAGVPLGADPALPGRTAIGGANRQRQNYSK